MTFGESLVLAQNFYHVLREDRFKDIKWKVFYKNKDKGSVQSISGPDEQEAKTKYDELSQAKISCILCHNGVNLKKYGDEDLTKQYLIHAYKDYNGILQKGIKKLIKHIFVGKKE